MTKYQNNLQDQRIASLEDKFSKMCDNHAHDVGGIRIDIADIKANQKYLIWFMLAILSAVISLWIK